MGPRNHAYGGGPDTLHVKGTLGSYIWACPPRLARDQCSQPHSLGGRSDAASSWSWPPVSHCSISLALGLNKLTTTKENKKNIAPAVASSSLEEVVASHRGTDEADCARRGGVVYDHEHCENGRIDQDSGPRSSDERGTSVATAKQLLLLLLLLLLMACAPSRRRLRLTTATDLTAEQFRVWTEEVLQW